MEDGGVEVIEIVIRELIKDGNYEYLGYMLVVVVGEE